jgi:outer membrane receptor for ferrienterochelin and colicins
LGEFRRGGNKFELPPHQSDISEQLEHNINNGGLKFDLFSRNYKHRISLFSSMQKVERSSYYGAQQNPNAYGITDDKTFVGGFQYGFTIDSLFPLPSELTMGAEYNLNELNDEATGYDRVFHQKVITQGLFIQNEWKNQKFSFLLGGRLDKHNLIKNPVISPRLNLRFAPSDAMNLRMSYSGGFRPPQAFDEDLHIDVIGGRASVVQLDPDLKMERSVSYSASVDLYKTIGTVETNLLIEGFYTNLKDVFVLEERGFDANGNLILERMNGSGAVVQGVNMEGKIAMATSIQFQFGATFQISTYKEPQSWSNDLSLTSQRKMFRTPDEYGYLTFNFKPGVNFNVAITGTYTGPMLVQHFAGYITNDSEKMTPRFLDLNIRLAHDYVLYKQTKIELSTGIQNVLNSYQSDFDKGEFRDAAYIYGPSLPRTLFFGLKFSI